MRSEQVEHRQLFFAQVLGDAALLFLVQALREGDQLGKEGIDIFNNLSIRGRVDHNPVTPGLLGCI
jgi:hypothetical protein